VDAAVSGFIIPCSSFSEGFRAVTDTVPKNIFEKFGDVIHQIHEKISITHTGSDGGGYKKADICKTTDNFRSKEEVDDCKAFKDGLARCFGLDPKYLLRLMTQAYGKGAEGSFHMDRVGSLRDRIICALKLIGDGAGVHFGLDGHEALLEYSFPAGISVMRMGNCGLHTSMWHNSYAENLNTSHAYHVSACCRRLPIVVALHFVALFFAGAGAH
jgi:hypothetical protein